MYTLHSRMHLIDQTMVAKRAQHAAWINKTFGKLTKKPFINLPTRQGIYFYFFFFFTICLFFLMLQCAELSCTVQGVFLTDSCTCISHEPPISKCTSRCEHKSVRQSRHAFRLHMRRAKWLFVPGEVIKGTDQWGSAILFPAEWKFQHISDSGQTPHYHPST